MVRGRKCGDIVVFPDVDFRQCSCGKVGKHHIVYKSEGKLYIRSESEELVVQMTDAEITDEQSIKAQRSAQKAYEVTPERWDALS